jgi:formate hydrogenlyase subunit 3/multisubunit Na+/H+ antiporter MnhD subunit
VAPAPGSAALSGIVVKAGVIGLIRFIPEGFPMPGWGAALTAFGMVTAFYGVAIGLTQRHPKRALAYSTVSQMGVVGVVLGAGLETGSGIALLLAAFYAMNHMLLKGSMFLAVGLASAGGQTDRRIGMLLMAMLGLGLAGLPLTGGAFAKYAIKVAPTSDIAVFLLSLSAAGTTALMLHVVMLLMGGDAKVGKNKGLVGPCAVLSLVAMALPTVLFPSVTGGRLSAALSVDALLGAAWPIALGTALALLVFRLRDRIPEIPAGDLFVLASRLAPAVSRLSGMAADVDRALGRWQVAGITVLGIVIALSTVMLVQIR